MSILYEMRAKTQRKVHKLVRITGFILFVPHFAALVCLFLGKLGAAWAFFGIATIVMVEAFAVVYYASRPLPPVK